MDLNVELARQTALLAKWTAKREALAYASPEQNRTAHHPDNNKYWNANRMVVAAQNKIENITWMLSREEDNN